MSKSGYGLHIESVLSIFQHVELWSLGVAVSVAFMSVIVMFGRGRRDHQHH